MLKCECGEILEEGFMGCLWCLNCHNNWKIPENQKDNLDYYMKISLMEM